MREKIITKIETQKRNPKRRSVFINGKFAFGLDEEVLYKLGVKKGESLTPCSRWMLSSSDMNYTVHVAGQTADDNIRLRASRGSNLDKRLPLPLYPPLHFMERG
jgi:hypothetical protein